MSNTTEAPLEEEDQWLLPLYSLIPAVIFIVGMIVLAVGGNTLIIISYFRDKQLQTVHNMYILNLAFTDLFLGCISMPFYAVYTLTAWHWPFGMAFCKFFMVVDFTLCLESVLLIIVISLDRLILVTKGAFYISKETFKVGKIKVCVSWVLAFALYSPAIIGWDYWTGESIVEVGDCDVEFAYSFRFTLVTSLIEFGGPFISISILNTLIYVKIRQRKTIFADKVNKTTVTQQNTPSVSTPEVTDNDDTKAVNNADSHSSSHGISIDKDDNRTLKHGQEETTSNTRHVNRSKVTHGIFTTGHTNRSEAQAQASTHQKCPHSISKRNLKAARALSVLVLALAVCWAPYTITTIIVAICDSCVDINVYEFLNWLLWFKSCINPFLYALNSLRFRKNIKKLLFFWRRH